MAVPITLSSVPAQTPYVQYVSGASQVAFPYPFEITQDSDLVCLVNGVQQATDSTYTLTGQGATGGGTLTFNLGQTAGTIVTLYRNIPIARITQLSQNGTFFSANFNNEYNRIYLILQQLQQSLLPGGNQAFALMVPNTNNPAPTTLLTPAKYANSYLSFDGFGNPQPAALTSSGAITLTILGNILYPRTAAEIAASVTPTYTYYPPGNILRYGADSSGVADSTTALNNALLSNNAVYAPTGTYLIGGASVINLQSGNVLTGDGPGTVFNFTNATTSQDYVQGSAVSYVTVSKIKFSCSGGTWTPSGYFGVVAFRANSTHCVVSDCEFTGYATQGVLLEASSYCRIVGNRFTNFVGVDAGDGADIHGFTDDIHNLAYNVIDGNYCFGGGTLGIGFETSSTPNTVMWKNVITNNRVGAHTAYGILNYTHQVGDSYNIIANNYVENISGTSTAQGGSAGAGIYVANAGGTNIVGNTVVNCCTATSNATLAPGGIGVLLTLAQALSGVAITGASGQFSCSAATLQVGNLITLAGTYGGTGSITGYASPTTYMISATNGSTTFTLVTTAGGAITTTAGTPTGIAYAVSGCSPINISGNSITDMAQGNTNQFAAGIFISTGVAGVTVTGNTITQQQAGNILAGIEVLGGTNNVVISGNSINIITGIATTRGIMIFANANIADVTIAGNMIVGCSYSGISFEQTSSYTTQNVTISGNTVLGGGAACIPLRMNDVGYASVTGNNLQATTVVALAPTTVTNSTFAGNILYTTGTNAIQTAGTCTACTFDKSNSLTGKVDNAGTLFHIEQYATASPSTGTWITGDVTWNSAAGVVGWQCTSGGTPGTWEPMTVPVATSTGWGSSTGGSVINNYNITDAGGSSSNTNKVVAELITLMKAAGYLGV